MGRPRRKLNADAELLCPGCDQWVPIENYYTYKNAPVWYIVNGVKFKKPYARCKPCSVAQRSGYSEADDQVQELTTGARWFPNADGFVPMGPPDKSVPVEYDPDLSPEMIAKIEAWSNPETLAAWYEEHTRNQQPPSTT